MSEPARGGDPAGGPRYGGRPDAARWPNQVAPGGHAGPGSVVHGELPMTVVPDGLDGSDGFVAHDRSGQSTVRVNPATGRAPGGRGMPLPESRRARYTLYAAGLVAVAVLSGVLWWAAHPAGSSATTHAADRAPSSAAKRPAGTYQFAMASGPVKDTDCAAHAYGEVKKFFGKTPCSSLLRSLYWTRVHGVRVFSSVSVVTMHGARDAAALKSLTDSNNTGNVADLLREGVKVTGAPKTVAGGGYASSRHGDKLTIVESKPATGTHLPEAALTKVSKDALRLGARQ